MKLLIPGKTKNEQIDAVVYILLSLCVLVVLIMRAMKVPFSHDEASTFYNYVQSADFIPFLSKADANNHFLNSFLTYIFYHLFGSSVFALRLSNLMFAPLYFYFCYKLSQELSFRMLKWIFLPVMIFTFHVIEFFAISRGYGLSLTFLIAALWQVLLAARKGRTNHYINANIFMLLSSLSIVIEIYNFALILGWSLASILFSSSPDKRKNFIKVLQTGIIPLVFMVIYTLFLKINGAYIEKGPTGLWDASLKTLFMSITDMNSIHTQKLLLGLCVLLFIPIVLLLLNSIRTRRIIFHPHLLFVYMLFGNLAIIVLVVKLFFSDYPESRLVLFLFPILIGSIIFTVDLLVTLTSRKIFVIIAIPLLFFPVHSFKAMNFEYITWNKYCHIPTRFYDKVMSGYKKGEIPPTISGHGTQAWAWEFLVRQSGGVANEMTTINFPKQRTRFQIINLQYSDDWRQYYDTIDFDAISNLHLLKKKGTEQKTKIQEIIFKGSTASTNDEFLNILEFKVNEFRNKNIQLDFDLSLMSFSRLIYGSLVIVVDDSSTKNLMYDEIHLNWIRDDWDDNPHNFIKSWLLTELPGNAAYIRIFLWNKGKTGFSLNKGRIVFSEIKETILQ